MRKKKLSKSSYIIIAVIIIAFGLSILIEGTPTGFIVADSSRQEFCDENGCIPDVVYANLPPVPSDFNKVKLKMDTSLYSVAESFSCIQWDENYENCLRYNPDEWYYLQPEFYGKPSTWNSEGAKWYTGLEGRGYDYLGVQGFGAFPGDMIISPINAGQDARVVTYIHTGWYVRTYQGMSLAAVYPDHGVTKLGEFVVDQNPSEIKNYFDIEISPDIILLEPTFPVLKKGWTKKIEMIIHVNPNTPPGKYLVGINPVSPPSEYGRRWFNQYEFLYTPVGGLGLSGGVFKVYLEVV